jgi:glutamate 5-kinase
VVNENDTVATNEIRFGDNDRLSARVAVMASAEELVLLSDVDGLYTGDPASDPAAVRLELVAAITPEIEAMAGGAGSAAGTGGMISKLAAARIATRAGCRVVIAPGSAPHPLRSLAAGGPCTRFPARANPRRARKEWLAGALGTMGVIRIDAGAARALKSGSSLLPAGVTDVQGAFERGDAVLVRGPDGADLAKGLCAYDAADARRISGQKTEQIAALLGWRGRDELIHRDDLVLL